MRGFVFLVCFGLAMGCQRQPAAEVDRPIKVNGGAEPALQKVTLALNWFPEVEHGGYYAAQLQGDYRRAGLDVEILPGGPRAPVIQQVARGDVTFGVSNADNVLFARAQQAPLVAIMAPLEDSPRCLMVHASAGIRTFDDLHDMTIAMSSSAAFARYLIKKVPLKNVQVVPYLGNVQQFLLHQDYAQQGYNFSEPFVARKLGGDPQVMMLSDLGFNPYTSVLCTSEKTIRDSPDLVRRMVAASVRGWQSYLTDPTATNRHIHELNPTMEQDALTFGAEALRPLALTDEVKSRQLGTMTLKRWQQLTDQLVGSDQLKPDAVNPQQAFSVEFLPRN